MAKQATRDRRRAVPEVEQPYEIPANWRWVQWGSVGTFTAGNAFKNEYQGFLECEIPFYKVGSLKCSDAKGYIYDSQNTISEQIRAQLKASLIPADSLIFAKIGEAIKLNRRGLNAIPCCIDNNLMAFISEKCLYLYAYYWSMNIDLYSYAHATMVPSIRKSDLQAIPFPLPPLAEQRRIVERVENFFSALDEARAKLQAVLERLEQSRAALLRKAFAGKLTEEWRKEHPNAGPWSKRALKDCGDWSGGGTPSMDHPEYWENADLLWITPKDMKSDWIENSLLRVNALAVENSSARRIETPSVLFVTRSGILRRTLPIALVKVPFTVNQDLKVLSPHEDIDMEYLFWACKSREKSILRKCMKDGTTVESVNTKALMAFEIPVAPLAEQRVIAARLKCRLTEQRNAKEAAESVLKQLELIKKVILGRAFRGELGTNRPDEPPADLEASEKG